jgi:hypothetical protein
MKPTYDELLAQRDALAAALKGAAKVMQETFVIAHKEASAPSAFSWMRVSRLAMRLKRSALRAQSALAKVKP